MILNKNKTILAFVNPKIKTFTWSSDDGKADVFVTTKKHGENTLLHITYQGETFYNSYSFSRSGIDRKCYKLHDGYALFWVQQ